MRYLIAITFLWAFSFSLIDVYLAGKVDGDFAVLTRVVLAGLLFLPLTRWNGIPTPLKLGTMVVGALMIGVTYLCLYRSFLYLTVPEVLLFTVTTPLYVSLIDDALNRRFSAIALASAFLAVLGAGYIRYDGITGSFLTGFALIQTANFAFAAGQTGYANLVRRYPVDLPQYRFFGYFFLGGLLITLPSFLLFGNTAMMPETTLQWGILLWLGVGASGAGLFLWNKGGTMVDAGTLAIMNNMLIPAGILVNLLFWNKDADLLRLTIGGVVIIASLWVNYRFGRQQTVTADASP
ncbi:MAG: biotin permease YigM [Bacteroidetes bacterium HLUCCA01]|nr:MAG: biotin permease YigM [Bacteroidetes bacterium HLUCCA01]